MTTAPPIDPLFFSRECSDARICLRTGPVCICGIEKLKAEREEALARAENWRNDCIANARQVEAGWVGIKDLRAKLDAAIECLKVDRTAFYNLIDMKALPHDGWDAASREQIARIDAALVRIGALP